MGKLPTYMGEREMSDAAMAKDLVDEIDRYASAHRRGNLVDRVLDACADYSKSLKEKTPGFTLRRIRAFRNREAAVVSYSEMVRLAKVAEAEMKLARQIEEARKSHAQYIAETTRLGSLAAFQDEAFHSDQVEGIRSTMGGVGVPGTGRGEQ